jgi:predicted DNA-binding transcriptional regulator AlpA
MTKLINGDVMQNSNNILKLPQTSKKTGLSRTTIYRLELEGKFPKKIKLAERAIGFLESEIDAWIQSRVAASRQEQNSTQ